MDILNNQFIIHQLVKQNSMMRQYIVTDIQANHETLLLCMFRPDLLPKELIDYYTNEFLHITQVTNKYVRKNSHFNSVRYHDNQIQQEDWYFYTTEYIDESTPLLTYLKGMSVKGKLAIFIDICRGIHYLHVKNIIYGSIDPNNIMIVNNQVKLKDLATIAMDKYNLYEQASMDEFFHPPYILTGGTPSRRSDIYSLGVLLLTMICEEPIKQNPLDYLEQLLEDTQQVKSRYPIETDKVLQLLKIIAEMMRPKDNIPTISLPEIAKEISELFSFTEPFIDLEILNKVYDRFRIVGREKEIDTVITNYEQMLSFKPSKKVFYLQGNSGTGKTRTLEELKFLYELKKGNVFASIGSKHDGTNDKEMWMHLLKDLIDTSETIVRDKYREKLHDILPDIHEGMASNAPTTMWNEVNIRSQILQALISFLSETSENHSIILMIDDIDKVSQFTIDLLFQVSVDVASQNNIHLVFAGPHEQNLQQNYAKEFVQRIKQLDIAEVIPLNPLNLAASSKMIEHMFSLQKRAKLSKQVYDQSYGNPQFIYEIMKDLYIRNIVYLNEQTGEWSINLPEKSNYSSLQIPQNMEQAMLNQLVSVTHIGKELLRKLSIFNEPVTLSELQSICELDNQTGNETIKQLIQKQIIVEIHHHDEKLYDFHNQTLKNIVYDKIQASERSSWHEAATTYFMSRINEENPTTTEIKKVLFHANRIKHQAILINMHRLYAELMKEKRHTKEQIYHLEEMYEWVDDELQRAKLLLEIGNLYAEVGSPKNALDSFEKAEAPILQANETEYIIAVYMNIANVYAFNIDAKNTTNYLKKAKQYINKVPNLSTQTLLEYKRILAIAKIGEGNYDLGIEILLNVIEQAGDTYLRTKGDALRTLAYIYIVTDKSAEALLLLEEAVTILEKENYPRGILLALNNIGVIYSYKEPKRAIDYFEKVRDLSEAYGNTISEIYAMANISLLYNREYRLEEAYRYARNSLRLAQKHGIMDRIYFSYSILIPILIQMNDYEKALEYYDLLRAGNEKGLPGLHMSHFNSVSVDLWTALGHFAKADRFRKKIIHEKFKRDKGNEAVARLFEQMQQIYSYEVTDKQLLQEAIETYKTIMNQVVDNEPVVQTTAKLIEQLLNKGLVELAKTIHSKLTNRLSGDVATNIRAEKYYIDSLMADGQTKQSLLERSITYAQQMDNKTLLAKMNNHLGNYFEKNNQLFDAMTHYLESWYNTRKQLQVIPQTYHLSYVHGNGLLNAYIHLENLYKTVFGKQFPHATLLKEKMTNSQLDTLLQIDVIDLFTREEAYVKHTHERAIEKQSLKLRNIADVVNHISGDSPTDLVTILQYAAAIMIADQAMVITENKSRTLEVIASNDGNETVPPYTYLFQRVRKTFEPVFISNHTNSPYDHIVQKGNTAFAGLICIPIVKHATVNDTYSTEHFLGYFYLDTNKMVNHFDEEHLQRCLLVAKYLTLLLEKIQLEQAASIDKMTGTLTRKYIEDKLHDITAVSLQNDAVFAIVMFDLDHFKQINDKYGHLMGDNVLAEVCRVTKSFLSNGDVIGRFGGEEFLIILPETNAETAMEVMEAIRQAIEQIRPLTEHEQITISSGIAAYPNHGMSVTKLLEHVDQALYVAKEGGRNKTVIWSEEFVHRTDTMNKLSGLFVGDGVTDYRNLTALIELVQLTNANDTFTNKVADYLHRVMDLIEADCGYLLLMEHGEITQTYGRKSQVDRWFNDTICIDEALVKQSIETKGNLYRVNWSETNEEQSVSDLHSVLAVPIFTVHNVIAVLYFSVKANKKIFNFKQSNAVTIYKEIMINILQQQVHVRTIT